MSVCACAYVYVRVRLSLALYVTFTHVPNIAYGQAVPNYSSNATKLAC